jgi:hypothetical protein
MLTDIRGTKQHPPEIKLQDPLSVLPVLVDAADG